MWPFKKKRPANPTLQIEYLPDNSIKVACSWPKTNEANRVAVATNLAALQLMMCGEEVLQLIFQSVVLGGEAQREQETAAMAEQLVEGYLSTDPEDLEEPVIPALSCFEPYEEEEQQHESHR